MKKKYFLIPTLLSVKLKIYIYIFILKVYYFIIKKNIFILREHVTSHVSLLFFFLLYWLQM